MNILVFDTATEIELIAISVNKRISELSSAVKISHSKTLINNIDSILQDLNISLENINLLGVGIGPGSFTGIRIAVTTARMLAQLLGIPLIGIKTHLLYASSVEANNNENILVAFDAKKERVFGALYKKNNDTLSPLEVIPPGDYFINSLLQKIDTSHKTILIGNGVKMYYSLIKNKILNYKFFSEFIPSGKDICNLTELLYRKKPKNNTNLIVPYYARKSDAEIIKNFC